MHYNDICKKNRAAACNDRDGGAVMVKFNILNMESFLQMVNACRGMVNLLYADGRKENINGQYEAQGRLLERFRENGNFLRIVLDIPDAGDYMNLVTYYIGNC